MRQVYVEVRGKGYNVHIDENNVAKEVVVLSKGKPYRNIGIEGKAAKDAIAKANLA